MIERTKAQKDEMDNLSAKDIIQNILSDPEFLALSSRQQLDVLLIMYNMLNNHLNSRKDMKKRDVNGSIKSHHHLEKRSAILMGN